MIQSLSPFLEKGYVIPAYFCDRKNETEQLIDHIKNGSDVTLFAYRRLGKTGLIKHCFYKLRNEKNLVCIYVDIFDTTNKSDFINKLATAIYNALPTNKTIGKKIISAIKTLRPVISFDEITGLPDLTITETQVGTQQKTIASLFSFLDNQNLQIVFAIDEFQQILSYPEQNMEAILRTQTQQLKNTSFVFCGSNQTQIHQIFNSAKRPFFASSSYMSLGLINREAYQKFILNHFKKLGKTISVDAVDFILNWTKRHTFYTQYLCNQIFVKTDNNINIVDVQKIANELLGIQEGKFYQFRSLLTKVQWKVLGAIAKEDPVTQPNKKEFISTYNLGSASIVNRALTALVNKEMILHNAGVEQPYYEVYDKFLMRWLQNK